MNRAWKGWSRWTAPAVLTVAVASQAIGAADPVPKGQAPKPATRPSVPTGEGAKPAIRPPVPTDDWTFRPTVIVRKGTSQGSGTVIASVAEETLVLTAAHVVESSGPLRVELHRYNFGLERAKPVGMWPRQVTAQLVATDTAADLAVLRIRGLGRMPYVARLAPDNEEPVQGTIVTSVGVDQGARLSGWRTPINEVAWFEIEGSGGERPFLVTAKPPEHGRSGGGLYLENGDLVGVCVGRAGLSKERTSGIFSSNESIRRLLRDHDLVSSLVRSEAERQNKTPRPARSPRPAITPTQSRPSR